MTRARSLAALAFLAGAAAPVAGPAAAACAGEGARAALVVDTGAAVTTYCVALPDDSVTGIELVQLAGEQHGLDYSLGFGGEAVCRLEGVGPEGDDCFGEYPEFWGYWRGDGSGGWTWAGTGGGGASIEDGDVDAWSWGTGDNGSNHQAPPPTEHDDVCPPVTQPPEKAPPRKPRPSGRAGGGAGQEPTAAAAAPVGETPRAVQERKPPDRKKTSRVRIVRERHAPSRPSRAPSPSPEPSALAAQPASTEEGGPPLTGLVGLAAAAGLGAAVWTGSRRRSGS